MLRSISCVVLHVPLALLPACGSTPPMEPYDFHWVLSGSHRVAPLQIFSSGQRIWMQFSPGQIVPALFGHGQGPAQLLSYTWREPYAIVQGEWPVIEFRGGSLKARATHEVRASARPAGAWTAEAIDRGGAAGAAASPEPPGSMRSATGSARSAPASAGLTASAGAAGQPPAAASYRVTIQDGTMRGVLSRWAQAAGWTFGPRHWAVDADIPLAGNADLGGNFKAAVRELLKSTELADRPLQPCFYSNRVLRVVPLAQACDRTAAPDWAAS
jgi:hypothetical protein